MSWLALGWAAEGASWRSRSWGSWGSGLGAVGGARLADRVPQARLRSLLGVALVAVALALIAQLLGPAAAAALRLGGST